MHEVIDLNKKGVKFFSEGKFSEAIAAFKQAIDLRPDYTDAYYNLGLAFTKAGMRVDAMHAYEALIALQPTHLGAHFQVGAILMQREKFKLALEHFTLLEREYPEHVESLINLAGCYLRLSRWHEARSVYEKVLQLVPNDVQALYNLGVLSAAFGRHLEAQQFYLQALKEDHALFAAHNNLAVLYLEMRDNEQALLHFRAAHLLQPQSESIKHSIRLLTEHEDIAASPEDYVRALFDSYADHYDVHLREGLAYAVPATLLAMVKEYGDDTTYDILDLGCGTGLCGEIFKPIAKKLVGVDLSPKMLVRAEEKRIYDELVEGEVQAYLKNHSSPYDLVVAGDVIVYFGDLKVTLQLIEKSLKPGGLLVFNAEISEDSPFSLMNSGRFQHHRTYIDMLALEAGFEVVLYKTSLMRRQYEQDVMGHFYLLRR